MVQFDQVSIIKKANVYFDGRCVSHTVLFADGSRKTVGVIFPGRLAFSTGTAERMEVLEGHARVLLPGQNEWSVCVAGGEFSVPAGSRFEIEVTETVHYVCHFDG